MPKDHDDARVMDELVQEIERLRSERDELRQELAAHRRTSRLWLTATLNFTELLNEVRAARGKTNEA